MPSPRHGPCERPDEDRLRDILDAIAAARWYLEVAEDRAVDDLPAHEYFRIDFSRIKATLDGDLADLDTVVRRTLGS